MMSSSSTSLSLSSSSNSPCAACKSLRRKCTEECVFAPYFPPDQQQKFMDIHKVYGASNVAKLLRELDICYRGETVRSLLFEASCRLKDPIYGCVAFVSKLQVDISHLRFLISNAYKELSTYAAPHPPSSWSSPTMTMMSPPHPPQPSPFLLTNSLLNSSNGQLIDHVAAVKQQRQHDHQMQCNASDQFMMMRYNNNNSNRGGGGGTVNEIPGGSGILSSSYKPMIMYPSFSYNHHNQIQQQKEEEEKEKEEHRLLLSSDISYSDHLQQTGHP